MQIGAFELDEPVPPLSSPHLFVALRPWIDVGSVATLALSTLEGHLGARDLGRLHRPGTFYDFTRYRPMLYRAEGRSQVVVPNTVLRVAQRPGSHDVAFLHILEPHAHGEEFIESLVQVAEHLEVRRYCQVGSMYGAGPHTRPLALTGSATEAPVQQYLESVGMRLSTYEGPTTIMALAVEQMAKRGIQSARLLVQLPPYARLDEDHRGQEVLLRILEGLYHFGLNVDTIAEAGARQYRQLDALAQADPRIGHAVRQMEQAYDAEAQEQTGRGERPRLPPEVEHFLRDLEKGTEPPQETR